MSMAADSINVFIAFLLLLITQLPLNNVVESRTLKHTKMQPQQLFKSFVDLDQGLSKGQTAKGIPEVRRYLNRFGYLELSETEISTIESEEFDEELEFAVKLYQKFFRLNITGKLDSATLQQMSKPRCGVPDVFIDSLPPPSKRINHSSEYDNGNGNDNNTFNYSYFSFFKGQPRWRNHYLYYKTYHTSVAFNYSDEEFESALENAAGKWSDNSVFTLDAASPGDPAEIVAGLHDGFHGDDVRFDGKYGILGHAYAPSDGRLHIDAAEDWSNRDDLKHYQFHMESVILHELGHILGLGHSTDSFAVMYPVLNPGTVHNILQKDDLDAIAYLYPTYA